MPTRQLAAHSDFVPLTLRGLLFPNHTKETRIYHGNNHLVREFSVLCGGQTKDDTMLARCLHRFLHIQSWSLFIFWIVFLQEFSGFAIDCPYLNDFEDSIRKHSSINANSILPLQQHHNLLIHPPAVKQYEQKKLGMNLASTARLQKMIAISCLLNFQQTTR